MRNPFTVFSSVLSSGTHSKLCCTLLGALLCLAFFTTAIAAEAPFVEGTVATCFDGDTLKLTDRRVVRLAGIDAPELGRGKEKADYYAREARNELMQLAQGHKVRLVAAGVETRDRHGRLIADVLLEDGQSLNDLMISRGAAFFYPHQDLSPQFQDRLRSLQQTAVGERQGFWALLLSLPLARANYTGNRASLRFFPADCPEAEHLKPRNRVYFGTLMDAFLAGYAPARPCSFWPTAQGR